jgi:putative transposase
LTALKDQTDTLWLREIDSQLLQQTLRDLDQAFSNFFQRRARFPRFKSRKRDTGRFRIPQRVKVDGGKVYVPKVGWVRIRQSREVEGETKSATFTQDACGHWHVCIVEPFEMPDTPLPPPVKHATVGIDAGLKDFAVLSNGERVPVPRCFRKEERKLRKFCTSCLRTSSSGSGLSASKT